MALTARLPATEGERTSGDAARHGARDSVPFALALVPFAFAIGAASASAGLSGIEAGFGTAALLAGASQLAAIDLIDSGGGIAITVVMVALINLRFVFYGAGLARWFSGEPLRWRLALAIPLVDQNFMLCQQRFAEQGSPTWRRQYYLASSAVLVVTFISCQVVAFRLGASLPAALGLHLAAPLAFVGMLTMAAKGQRERIAGLIAGALVVATAGVLGAGALPMAAMAGVGAGLRWNGGQR